MNSGMVSVPRPAAVRILAAVVDACRRRAPLVVLAGLALAVFSVVFVVRNLGMDTDTARLISADEPWRQREIEYRRAFPENLHLAIVVDAETAERAEEAADALAERLAARPELFRIVRRPDALPYFRRNGLLFLSVEDLKAVTERLVDAQPLIGRLAADTTVRGLFETLNVALDGLAKGEGQPEMLDRALVAIAESLEAILAGQTLPLSWQTLLTGREPGPEAKRRFVLANVARDYGRLEPAARARAAVRAAAADLGLTPDNGVRVRMTGTVALNDEEFASVAEGAGWATAASLALVALILFLGLRSFRIIGAILATLVVGLVATAAFAAATVGKLNLISVAFAVLFVGMGVDFGIQFSVRYRDERHRCDDFAEALRRAATGIGGALALATGTLLVGFLAFLPTAYRGVAELGLVAGGGMVIAFALNVTLLPALLALLKPPGEPEPVGYPWAAGIDRFLVRHRRGVAAAGAALGILGLGLASALSFDFNPLNLKDPRAESVATLRDLMDDPATTPNSVNVIAASPEAAAETARRLKALPEVKKAVTVYSFVPSDQDQKLPLLEDLNLVIGPSLAAAAGNHPPADAVSTLAALRECAGRLRAWTAGRGTDGAAGRLATAIEATLARTPPPLAELERVLIGGLGKRLAELAAKVAAGPVGFDDLPEELVRQWVTDDGRARIEVSPNGDGRDNAILRRFVAAVRTVAPGATGTPVSIQEAGDTVVRAFATAGALALAAIAVLLLVILRTVRDTLLVLAPLLLAALLTLLTCVGVGMPLTFANIIALPLLFAIGVAYAIYFVVNWRQGVTAPLQSSMARAVVFSALTTIVAFGSLALSSHPGTADMGKLLTISLGFALFTSLVFLPALLALAGRPGRGTEGPAP
jgi:hopanoid biosynthesis associated RND transporter like protein HpnN